MTKFPIWTFPILRNPFDEQNGVKKKTKSAFSVVIVVLDSLKIIHLPYQFTQWGAYPVKTGVITG